MDRHALIALYDGVRRLDKRAEHQFYQRYKPMVSRELTGRVSDVTLIEDLAHDTLLKVMLKIRDDQVDQPESLDSFVCQTAKYLMLGWYRRKGNQNHGNCEADEVAHPSAGVEHQVISQERDDIVTRLIDDLTMARDREILRRAYVMDDDKQDLCEAMELGASHFDRVISRARGRLRSLIETQPEETRWALQV